MHVLEIWMNRLRSYKTRFQIYSLAGTIVLLFKVYYLSFMNTLSLFLMCCLILSFCLFDKTNKGRISWCFGCGIFVSVLDVIVYNMHC